MTRRFLEVASRPATVTFDTGRITVRAEGKTLGMVATVDLGALLLAHPGIQVSVAAMNALAREGIPVVLSDEKHLPSAMLLPLRGNGLQAERFRAQAAVSTPLRKQIWRVIVQAKIREQARLLEHLHGDDAGLMGLARSVRSGDTGNVEARAGRIYWRALFRDPAFRRRRIGGGRNNALNYGYAILRSLVARHLCGAGLHPGLGIYHHNRYDPFCLADDVIEPFRPLVDRIVVEERLGVDDDDELSTSDRRLLAEVITARCQLQGESREIGDVLTRTASSLAESFLTGRNVLKLPDRCI